MSINETLVSEFIYIATEDLTERGIGKTSENIHQLISTWCEVYEDVPPRNRAEERVRDALQEARARLVRHEHLIHQTV